MLKEQAAAKLNNPDEDKIQSLKELLLSPNSKDASDQYQSSPNNFHLERGPSSNPLRQEDFKTARGSQENNVFLSKQNTLTPSKRNLNKQQNQKQDGESGQNTGSNQQNQFGGFLGQLWGKKDWEHETYENLDQDDQENEQHYKSRLFVAKNNLKLNLLLSMFLLGALSLVFSLNWYCYQPTSDGRVEQSDEEICFKILFTKVSSSWITIRDFISLDCPSLPSWVSDRSTICNGFNKFYNCFILYIVLKALGVILTIHSIVSSFFMINDRTYQRYFQGIPNFQNQNNEPVQNYNTFNHQQQHLQDPDSSKLSLQSDQFNPKKFKNCFQTVILELIDKKQTSYKWGIIFNFLAIGQWLILTGAFTHLTFIEISPYLDLVSCFIQLGLRYHQQIWEYKLRIIREMKQYI